MRNKATAYYTLLAIFGVIFFIFNYYTPINGDDYAYHYIYVADPHSAIERPSSEPIRTFADVIRSQIAHYIYVNGRIASLSLAQIFCGLTGKWLFNILNTLVFVMFLHIMQKFVYGRHNILCISLGFLMLMLPFPLQGETLYWITGAVNYLWPITFSLYLLYFLFERPRVLTLWQLALFCIVTLVISWMNESTSLPVSALLLGYGLLNRKKITPQYVLISITYFIGTTAMALSPGSQQRALATIATSEVEKVDLTMLQMVCQRAFSLAIMIKVLKLPLLGIIVAILYCFRPIRRTLQTKTKLLLALFLFSLLLTYGVNMQEERVYSFVVTMAFIVTGSFIVDIVKTRINLWVGHILTTMVTLCCIPAGVYAFAGIKRYHDVQAEVVASIKASPKDCILETTPSQADNRYAYNNNLDGNRKSYHNRVKAFYYGKNFIVAYPQVLLEYISNPKKLSDCPVLAQKDGYTLYRVEREYFFITSKSSCDHIDYITYQSDPTYHKKSRAEQIKQYFLGLYPDKPDIITSGWSATTDYRGLHFIVIQSKYAQRIELIANGERTTLDFTSSEYKSK